MFHLRNKLLLVEPFSGKCQSLEPIPKLKNSLFMCVAYETIFSMGVNLTGIGLRLNV